MKSILQKETKMKLMNSKIEAALDENRTVILEIVDDMVQYEIYKDGEMTKKDKFNPCFVCDTKRIWTGSEETLTPDIRNKFMLTKDVEPTEDQPTVEFVDAESYVARKDNDYKYIPTELKLVTKCNQGTKAEVTINGDQTLTLRVANGALYGSLVERGFDMTGFKINFNEN